MPTSTAEWSMSQELYTMLLKTRNSPGTWHHLKTSGAELSKLQELSSPHTQT
jgi:hypothetical protein